jgi:hypothetical protein
MSNGDDVTNGKDEQVPADDPAALLRTWERTAASTIGGLAGIGGTVAIFITSNQAGTAALLIIAAAFMLIGLQGTPLSKLTSGSSTVVLAERKRISNKLVAVATQRDDPKEASTYLEAASLVDPRFTNSPLANSFIYRQQVSDAMVRLGFKVDRLGNGPAQYLVGLPDNPIFVHAKYQMHGSLEVGDISETVNRAAQPGTMALLIVTNAPLSRPVQDFNSSWGDRHPRAEAITWTGRGNDALLKRALLRAMQPLTPPPTTADGAT